MSIYYTNGSGLSYWAEAMLESLYYKEQIFYMHCATLMYDIGDNAAQGQSKGSHTSTVPSRDSTQPISEDPLYAVPDQVKRKIRLNEGDVGGAWFR